MDDKSLVLKKIEERLAKMLKGKSKLEKAKILHTFGYTWQEVTELDKEGMESFLAFLMEKPLAAYQVDEDTFKGYTISRPENPRNVRDISFKINGWNPGDGYQR